LGDISHYLHCTVHEKVYNCNLFKYSLKARCPQAHSDKLFIKLNNYKKHYFLLLCIIIGALAKFNISNFISGILKRGSHF
jgi:hypothetical protein